MVGIIDIENNTKIRKQRRLKRKIKKRKGLRLEQKA